MKILCLLCSVLGISTSLVAQQSARPATGVTYERLVEAARDPGNWLMYSGQYNGQRFSRLNQINEANVDRVRVKWVRQFVLNELFETSPLVLDGTMYATLPLNKVVALDARTGLRYWGYEHPLPEQIIHCCGRVNRGLAMLGDTLYMGTLDAHLVALDAKSGNVVWNVKVAEHEAGYSITGAPLIVKDMVITGIAGGEYGIRGFLDAYDTKTGELRWRRYTIPVPGEPGNDSWADDSWQTGGAPTWLTGSFDPELNLIYWGVGNPGPDWNGEVREGDNLYSDCVLAINADSGEVVWHFQFTPHDVWDWDACQIPVLLDAEYQGRSRKLILWANRNAFYYVLDRESGEFLHASAFAKQTWAESIDKKGRPRMRPNILPTKEGTFLYPDLKGGTNWYSPSFSPLANLFFVTAYDGGGTYYQRESEYQRGRPFLGGFGTLTEFDEFLDSSYVSAIRAFDPLTGQRRWEHKIRPKGTSGLLSTAGNLVFGGTPRGNFFALNAATGKELWHLDIGGRIHAAPVTYLVDGQQYVTIAAGSSLFTFGL